MDDLSPALPFPILLRDPYTSTLRPEYEKTLIHRCMSFNSKETRGLGSQDVFGHDMRAWINAPLPPETGCLSLLIFWGETNY